MPGLRQGLPLQHVIGPSERVQVLLSGQGLPLLPLTQVQGLPRLLLPGAQVQRPSVLLGLGEVKGQGLPLPLLLMQVRSLPLASSADGLGPQPPPPCPCPCPCLYLYPFPCQGQHPAHPRSSAPALAR